MDSDSDSESAPESDDDHNEASPSSFDFYINADGCVCLKPDSPLWEQVRFGNQLCMERASKAPGPPPTPNMPVAAAVVTESSNAQPGKECEAPTQIQVKAALTDLENVLSPARKTGRGRVDPELDPYMWKQMESMWTMLNFYTNP